MKCKPGDIAVVIGTSWPEAIGHFVDVVEMASLETMMFVGRNNIWLVRPKSPMTASSPWGGRITVTSKDLVLAADEDLKPIRPPAPEDEVPAPPVDLEVTA